MKKRKAKSRTGPRGKKRKGTPRERLRKALFDINSWEYSKCLAPPEHCPRPAIRAHSVQNARALELLARDGQVIGITRRTDKKGRPQIKFDNVGRNLATTFAGLCAEHDQAIFAPIDREPFDTENREHLFLAAYRATFRELHATCAAGSKLQSGYVARISLGFDPKNVPTAAGLRATEQMALAYDTYLHKQRFDNAYLHRDFGGVVHDVIELNVGQPTVAACALFSVHDAVTRERDWVRACLNILPLSTTTTAAVFSYPHADANAARAVLSPILDTTGDFQKYELSRRLLNSCENFVLAPDFYSTWAWDKKRVILRYYASTILTEDLTYNHADLMLF